MGLLCERSKRAFLLSNSLRIGEQEDAWFVRKRSTTRQNKIKRDHSLLQPLVEPAQDDRGDVVQVDARHRGERGVVPRHVRVQQVVQLRGELDARRPAADDAEVEQPAPVRVRYRGLVRLFEACVGCMRRV